MFEVDSITIMHGERFIESAEEFEGFIADGQTNYNLLIYDGRDQNSYADHSSYESEVGYDDASSYYEGSNGDTSGWYVDESGYEYEDPAVEANNSWYSS